MLRKAHATYYIRFGNKRNIVECHMIQRNKSKHEIKDQFALKSRTDFHGLNICHFTVSEPLESATVYVRSRGL